MQILPINLLKVISQNNQHKTSMQSVAVPTQSPDSFSKSPAFKGMEAIKPFLEGEYKYTPENVKLFNKFLSELNLKDRTNNFLNEMIANAKNPGRFSSDPMYYTFNLDFLIKTLSEDELIDINLLRRFSFNCLPAVQFDETDKPKVLAMIDKCCKKNGYADYYETTNLHEKAIKNENIPLLKILFGDLQASYLIDLEKHIIDADFTSIRLPLILKGRKSNKPEIKELFTGENLYSISKNYPWISTLLHYKDDSAKQIGLEIISHIKPLAIKTKIIDDFAHDPFQYLSEYAVDILASLPITAYERLSRRSGSEEYQPRQYYYAKNVMKKRMENLVLRNGFDSPMNFLNCLKDSVMSNEILAEPIEGTTLIKEISSIKLDNSNKKVMSEILKELSKIKYLEDIEPFREAALIAAERGNVELLKYFETRHIHFANNLEKPVEEYPLEVQDILRNAKINDPKILEIRDAEKLERYLKDNPNVDINSTNLNGENILTKAFNTHFNLKIFEMLSKRNDIDWNMVDNSGRSFLLQLVSEDNSISALGEVDVAFRKQVMKILRELPEGRLDVNYINYNAMYEPCPVSALSKLALYTKQIKWQRILLDELLKFKNIDTNTNPANDTPLAFEFYNNVDVFRKLYLHPNTNRTLTDFKDLYNHFVDKDIILDDEIMDIVENQMDYDFIDNVKKLYDKNGMLTLDEIEKLVNYEHFPRFVDEKYNIVGENIGHFIAETFIEPNDIKSYKKLIKILEKLKASGYNFNSKDDLDETPLDKAIEGENEIVADLLRDYM